MCGSWTTGRLYESFGLLGLDLSCIIDVMIDRVLFKSQSKSINQVDENMAICFPIYIPHTTIIMQ